MPLLVGGALLVLIAILSLSGSNKGATGKQKTHTLVGALAVGVAVILLVRAGLVWLAAGVAFLWMAASRVGGAGRHPGASTADSPRGRGGKRMSLEEAHQMLGLEPGASREQILAEYRRLMKKVHPDQGGTTYLATRLNEAKDVLLENAPQG